MLRYEEFCKKLELQETGYSRRIFDHHSGGRGKVDYDELVRVCPLAFPEGATDEELAHYVFELYSEVGVMSRESMIQLVADLCAENGARLVVGAAAVVADVFAVIGVAENVAERHFVALLRGNLHRQYEDVAGRVLERAVYGDKRKAFVHGREAHEGNAAMWAMSQKSLPAGKWYTPSMMSFEEGTQNEGTWGDSGLSPSGSVVESGSFTGSLDASYAGSLQRSRTGSLVHSVNSAHSVHGVEEADRPFSVTSGSDHLSMVHSESESSFTYSSGGEEETDDLERHSEEHTLMSTRALEAFGEVVGENRPRSWTWFPAKHWLSTPKVMWAWLYFCVNVIAFTATCIYIATRNPAKYEKFGMGILISRASAMVIQLNCALILLSMCRHLMNNVRQLTISRLIEVPFDESIEIHRLAAVVMVVASIVHTCGHFSNVIILGQSVSADDANKGRGDLRLFDWAEGEPHWYQIIFSVPVLTGVAMFAVLLVIFALAVEWVRRRRFEVFWYSHHLYWLFFLLLFLHPAQFFLGEFPTTWVIVGLPMLLYTLERLWRFVREFSGEFALLEFRVYPSRVVALRFSRPPHFNYLPGQYLFINMPGFSRAQWHPYTITSSPHDDTLSVHVRALGDWTSALFDGMSEVQALAPVVYPDGWVDAQRCRETPLGRQLCRISIDGPFGAPSQLFMSYKRVVCVGAGIGVTPFASILRALRSRNLDSMRHGSHRRIYFVWINSAPNNFDWFSDVLAAISRNEYSKSVVRVRAYLTRMRNHSDSRAWPLHGLLRASERFSGVDPVSGLQGQMAVWGTPDWATLFRALAARRPGAEKRRRFGVFFCGPPVLGEAISTQCKVFSQHGVSFDYFEENF